MQFTIDITLTGTVQATSDTIGDLIRLMRGELAGLDPRVTITGPDGAVAELTEISLGGLARRQPTMSLVAVNTALGLDIALDGMVEPYVCDQYGGATVPPGCHIVYDETSGDGYNGTCPACADAADSEDA